MSLILSEDAAPACIRELGRVVFNSERVFSSYTCNRNPRMHAVHRSQP